MRKDRRVGLLCAILSLSVFLSCLPRVARAEETEIPCYSVTEGLWTILLLQSFEQGLGYRYLKRCRRNGTRK